MRICVLCQSLYTLGGVQRVLTTLFNEMVDHDGIEITVMMPVAPNESNFWGLSNKVNVINTIDYAGRTTIKTFFWKLLRKINRKTLIFTKTNSYRVIKNFILLPGVEEKYLCEFQSGYDIVIGVGCWYSILLSYLAPKIDSNSIGWMHSTYESYFENTRSSTYGLAKIFKTTCTNLDELIVLTKGDKLKFDKELLVKSKVLYNPVANEFFGGKRKFNGNHKILFVGRISMYHKGLDLLVDIVKRIKESIQDIEITIVGDGPDREKFIKLIKDNGLEENVNFVGKKSNVKEYYKNANVVLVPSRYEGFGLVLIESMACGTPVVAFENRGPNEIINNNINGILIRQYDLGAFSNAVIRLIEEPELWSYISSNGYKRACQFSTERIKKRFLNYITFKKEV